MGFFKEATEAATIALEKARVLHAWASVSFLRVMLVVFLLGISLLVAQYTYVNYLLAVAKKGTENRTLEFRALGIENGYKVVLDAITLCLDSAKDEPKLHAWYCEQAVAQYRQASTHWPQERVNEVIAKLAYGAMKNDVSNYLRNVELDRLIQSPASREEEVLTLLLNKTAVWLWIFIVLTGMLSAFLALWVLPNNKKFTPDA